MKRRIAKDGVKALVNLIAGIGSHHIPINFIVTTKIFTGCHQGCRIIVSGNYTLKSLFDSLKREVAIAATQIKKGPGAFLKPAKNSGR